MSRAAVFFVAVASGLISLAGGFAAELGPPRGTDLGSSGPNSPGRPAFSGDTTGFWAPLGASKHKHAGWPDVLPAVARQEHPDTGLIRQMAGTIGDFSPVQSITSVFKGGIEKLTAGFVSATPATPADDPTALSSEARPSAQLYIAMGRLAEGKGNFAKAEEHYRQALRLEPRHLAALATYARMKDRQGRLDEAIRLYLQAARVHPRQAPVFNDLGLCYARRKAYRESLAALERAIQLQPREPLYRNNMATVLMEIGDVDRAFDHLKAVHSEAVAYYNVGYLLEKQGQTKAASALFAQALRSDPSLEPARIWLEKLSSTPIPRGQPESQSIAGRPQPAPGPQTPRSSNAVGVRIPPRQAALPRRDLPTAPVPSTREHADVSVPTDQHLGSALGDVQGAAPETKAPPRPPGVDKEAPLPPIRYRIPGRISSSPNPPIPKPLPPVAGAPPAYGSDRRPHSASDESTVEQKAGNSPAVVQPLPPIEEAPLPR